MDFLSSIGGIVGGIVGVAAFFALLGILKATIKVAPPDRLLVVTGRRAVRGGKSATLFSTHVPRQKTIKFICAVRGAK